MRERTLPRSGSFAGGAAAKNARNAAAAASQAVIRTVENRRIGRTDTSGIPTAIKYDADGPESVQATLGCFELARQFDHGYHRRPASNGGAKCGVFRSNGCFRVMRCEAGYDARVARAAGTGSLSVVGGFLTARALLRRLN